MSVRSHRIVAISILATSVVVLLTWGRSMGIDGDEVKAVRDQLQGQWVATLVQAGENRKVEGPAASDCRVDFDGKLVTFHHLIDGIDATGTFTLERDVKKAWVDFKLDAGWIIGLYEIQGDNLKLCLNPFALPERLGVPTRPRPRRINAGDERHLYVFRKVSSGS